MLKHISALAVFAAVPLVMTGCGSSDGSQLTKLNTLGQNVKFSDNSADVTTLPFYFEGTRTIGGFDTTSATATPLKLTTTPAPALIQSTNLLEKVSLQMKGEVVGATATLPTYYKLTVTYFNANDVVNTQFVPAVNPNGQILGGSSAATGAAQGQALSVTGAENEIVFHDRATREVRGRITLDEDWFGHFGPDPDEVLFVLGWRHVIAVRADLSVAWTSRWIAVDGIVWQSHEAGRITLSAEHDPPGGWLDVVLDDRTGRIVEGVGWASGD